MILSGCKGEGMKISFDIKNDQTNEFNELTQTRTSHEEDKKVNVFLKAFFFRFFSQESNKNSALASCYLTD